MLEFLQDILQSEELRALLMMIITGVATWVGKKFSETSNKTQEKLQAEAKAFESAHGVEQTKLLKELAMTGVRFAQQRFKDSGADRKLYEAIEATRAELNKYDVEIGGVELEEYIEEAYNIAKEEFKKQKGEAEQISVEITEDDAQLAIGELEDIAKH